MTPQIITKKEAVQNWVQTWNEYPSTLLKKAIGDDFHILTNITPFTIGTEVYYDQADDPEQLFEITHINLEDDIYTIASLDEPTITLDVELSSLEPDENDEFFMHDLPMWNTLWNVPDFPFDDEDKLLISQCGINIYTYDDGDTYLTLLGINGAGYDFYESHWIPLYDALGLQLHTSEERIEHYKELENQPTYIIQEIIDGIPNSIEIYHTLDKLIKSDIITENTLTENDVSELVNGSNYYNKNHLEIRVYEVTEEKE